MMSSWLRHFSMLALMMFIGASALPADLESAKRAYEQKDYATALKEFTPLADQGKAEAQLYLGKMYMMGQGVLKDPDLAIKWLKASASQGNADAQFFLGSIYLLPQTDVPEGMRWMRLSAEQGNKDAQYLVGKVYIQGLKEVARDPIQADMWLRLAAKDNLEFYQNQLLAAEEQMTPEQIARGKAMAEAWKPKAAAATPNVAASQAPKN
jgi:hypothetical protein